ncbi:MAG TPA: D-glycerate dehydrogenase [Panacibacter sp.]|nr:D-glycerate dehydrogenase [Panacibacter sp.]
MQKILITRPVPADIVERLKQYFEVAVNEGKKYSANELAIALKEMDGLLVAGAEKIDGDTIAGANRLKAVCITAAGYNSIDVDALTKAGIIVTNAPGPANETVADFTWGLMIATARRIAEAARYVQEGNWKTAVGQRFYGTAVHGKTLGIIGMGRIGQAIAKRGTGFNMKVIYHNRKRVDMAIEQDCNAAYATKETLLNEADFVVLALPFTKNNYHIIDTQELEIMKQSAILINIARGGLINEAALADALQQKKIAAAALDVFEQEPLIFPALPELPNVLLTPHIAGGTEETQYGLASAGADNLIAALGYGPDAFQPPAILNPQVYGK